MNPLFHLYLYMLFEPLPIDELLDQFFRDNEIRLSSLVLSAKGEAREALQLKENGEIPAFRLIGLGENEHKVSRILPPVTLANLIENCILAAVFYCKMWLRLMERSSIPEQL